MSHEALPKNILQLIKPQQVRSYALAKGWQRVPDVNGRIALSTIPRGKWDQLIVPMDESFDDYAKRLRDVVENLAAFESRPVVEVLNDLMAADADILRYRVASSATGRGSIPLMEGIRILEGAKRSILAAACSVLNPITYHPRMSRTEAQQLLNACHLGQTERGSYSVSVSCPLRAVEQDQALLPGNEPFTRQAVAMLMRSLSRIVVAIEADMVPNVFRKVPEEPVISANLCEAILQMQPQDENSQLDVKVSWALRCLRKTQSPAWCESSTSISRSSRMSPRSFGPPGPGWRLYSSDTSLISAANRGRTGGCRERPRWRSCTKSRCNSSVDLSPTIGMLPTRRWEPTES